MVQTYFFTIMHTSATIIASRTSPPTPAPAAMGTIDCASVTDSVELPVGMNGADLDVAVVPGVAVDVFVVVAVEFVVLVVITENIQMVFIIIQDHIALQLYAIFYIFAYTHIVGVPIVAKVNTDYMVIVLIIDYKLPWTSTAI